MNIVRHTVCYLSGKIMIHLMKPVPAIGVAIVALCASAPLALANNTITLDVNNYSSEYPGYDGGEFTATLNGSLTGTPAGYSSLAVLSNGTFETFCVELNNEFSNGGTYNYAITDYIQPNKTTEQTLTQGVAYLYSQFAQGTLADFNYSLTAKTGGQYDREIDGTELQTAIWYLMGEVTLTSTQISADPFIALAEAHGGTTAVTGTGFDGVSVLDLTTVNSDGVVTAYNQDQLIYTAVPDGGTTIALIGLSLLGILCFRRKVGSKA